MAQLSCPSAPETHVDKFAAFLAGEGYAPRSVYIKRKLVADLGAWLKCRGLTLAQLDERHFNQFYSGKRVVKFTGGRLTGAQFLLFLRDTGVLPSLPLKIDRSPVGNLTRSYARFLLEERGLAAETIESYLHIVTPFLRQHVASSGMRLRSITPRDLHRFVLRESQRVGRARAQQTVTALRSFLRFLLFRGLIRTDLAAALPAVANWRMAHIPKALAPQEVELVLRDCDRETPIGQRDFAILLLLARLGLRGGEVRAMTLDDIDWRQGEIVVRGKGRRFERLPLPKDVGAALAQYLRHARPRCKAREVFITMNAPRHALTVQGLSSLVRRALERAGLNPACKGAYLFRHSFATNMLRRGASLGEIGQLLRHRRQATTQIYAKVDVDGMRDISLPWMEYLT
jgi:site-specific recombinase XerD